MNLSWILSAALLLGGCASNSISESQANAVTWASQEPGQAAERSGIATQETYPKIVREALHGDSQSLSKVFQVSPATDAAARELQSGILAIIIQSIGDGAFCHALKQHEQQIIERNVYLLSSELGDKSSSYPQTMSLK